MKDILILKDQTNIELETGASLSLLNVLFNTKYDMLETWDKLTNDNLSEVQVINGYGLVVANYKNLILVSETSVLNPDNTILTSFNLRELSQQEIDIAELKSDMEALNEVIGG